MRRRFCLMLADAMLPLIFSDAAFLLYFAISCAYFLRHAF